MNFGAGLNQFLQEHSLGHVYENPEVTVFFGNAKSDEAAVRASFPDYQLSILNQTHSDHVVHSPFTGAAPDADAHWTQNSRVALCVRTADCIPILIHEPVSGMVGAAHAGWRGVENEIVIKLFQKMKEKGAIFDHARAWIGPHIGAESFEVGRDVGARLEARFEAVRGFSPEMGVRLPHDDIAKVRVNLLAIVRAQLASVNIEEESVLEFPVDTFRSEAHHSFRRDRDRAGRQISFIALKSGR